MKRSCSSPGPTETCLATRLLGKSVTMVLMAADPVFDSLAPVIALPNALWNGWMSQATKAKCVKVAQTEQRDSARRWTAVKGPFSAVVATLNRVQWTILEHDPFFWCMHDGRTLPLTACTSCSRRRRGRGNGGVLRCEGLDRAVFAPQFASLHTQRLSMPEQAYLRSVVVDGRWAQLRKYRVARTLLPPCALCGSEAGSLMHRHTRCSEVSDVEPCNMPGLFYTQRLRLGSCGSTSLSHHERWCQRSMDGHQGTQYPTEPAGRVTAA